MKRANLYKNVIFSSHFLSSERLQCISTLWSSVAMPGILYGADVIPLSDTAVGSIETIQFQVGKSALCVPQSTASPAVNLELGWKPVQLLVDEAVLGFFNRVTDPNFKGSGLVSSCMDWACSSTTSPYTTNLLCLAVFYYVSLTDLPSLTLKSLCDHWVTRL